VEQADRDGDGLTAQQVETFGRGSGVVGKPRHNVHGRTRTRATRQRSGSLGHPGLTAPKTTPV